MELTQRDQQRLKQLIQNGLPLVPEPYQTLAEQLGTTEDAVITTLTDWHNQGLIRRFGIVVNHPKLGYQANAMVVWDIPDNVVDAIGVQIKESGIVSLCYRRPRQRPHWPYNLFCMIHDKCRTNVQTRLDTLIKTCHLSDYRYQLLFSTRQFKQCGGRYAGSAVTQEITDGQN